MMDVGTGMRVDKPVKPIPFIEVKFAELFKQF